MKQTLKLKVIQYLPVLGCISTGIIYVSIGVIAILSFLKLKNGGADETSLFAFLNQYTFGNILVWIILLGTLCYIFWRIYESITDPYDYGKTFTGYAKRVGIALSTVADALIAYAAFGVILGNQHIPDNGDPKQLQQLTNDILSMNMGRVIILVIAVVVAVTAIIQLWYGITRGYKERIEIEEFSPFGQRMVFILGWLGYIARGAILGIIGFSFFKAGLHANGYYVVNTDKAFDFIGDNLPHTFYILASAGTVCYGIFMFVLGITYDIDKDNQKSANHS